MTDATVRLDSAAQRIEVQVRGDLDTAVLGRITEETLHLVTENAVLCVLVDLTAMDNAPPASALQRLPDYYAARGIDRGMRIAIVLPERGDAQGLSRFYKLAAKRQDYRVDAFETHEAAVAWLNGGATS